MSCAYLMDWITKESHGKVRGEGNLTNSGFYWGASLMPSDVSICLLSQVADLRRWPCFSLAVYDNGEMHLLARETL